MNTIEINRIKELKKISNNYFQKIHKDQKVPDADSFFTQVSLSLIAQGTHEEKEFLKSCLVDNWLATCEYKHCQAMVSEGDLKEIKEFLTNINNPCVIDIWLRSAISHQNAEVFKLIANYKAIDLSIELAKLSVIAHQYEILDYWLEKNQASHARDDLLYVSLMCDSPEMGIFLLEHGASVKNTYEVIKADLKSDAWVIIKYSKQLKLLESQEASIKLKNKLKSNLNEKLEDKKVKI